MIASLPAVQHSCKRAVRNVCMTREGKRDDKRIANRRHRRALNRATRRVGGDPERFDGEAFDAPTYSDWDMD